MNEITVQIDPEVFNPVYVPLLKDMARTQIIYGGSSSGKSVFVAQRCVVDLLKGGRNYLAVRKVSKDLRRSVFNEISKIIEAWGLGDLFNTNKTEMTITCQNGYQVLFAGLDDVSRLKSITPAKGVITDIWVEEATEVDWSDLKQLNKRLRGRELRSKADIPKRVTLTFNPILQTHHIYVDFFAPIAWADDQTKYRSPELSITKTWYVHNRFLTEADVADLLNEADEYYRQVYTFGNWGVLGNVIFKNWVVADLTAELLDDGSPNPYYLPAAQRTNHRNGLDFGFSNDPAAVPVSHYDEKRKTIYVHAEIYERGLTNDVLAKEILDLIGKQYITADSAEPKSIAEVIRYGVNAHGAVKGKDSIDHGIQWLQQQTIVVDKSCIHTQNELRQYKWKEDKDGNAMRIPVDKFNHLIDGLRYAFEQDMLASRINWEGAGADTIVDEGDENEHMNRWK